MKGYMTFLFAVSLFIGIATNAADVQQFDPTKVLVDMVSGDVIFMPRDIDYQYSLDKIKIEGQVEVNKTTSVPSIKDKIFGGKCSKKV
jgi:hypothetical protein